MRYLLICCLVFLLSDLYASDTIVVRQDPRMQSLTERQAIINKRSALLTSSGSVKGFRVQVINTNKRDDATRVKSELLSRFPEHKSYIMFQAPYFKVRIGNFLKREEAEKLRKQLLHSRILELQP
ncbi:MAG: SPOR domain-containing protein [Sediminibacterium sp.]|nr:SPOR domain-containing protein [Sediminibacterium sp.]